MSNLSRRGFMVSCLVSLGTILGKRPLGFAALGEFSQFTICELSLTGKGSAERNSALSRLLIELMKRTSVDGSIKPEPIRLDNPRLFYNPFLILYGDAEFAPLSSKERLLLERYLRQGGMLFIDDCSGLRTSPFDRAVRRELGEILPGLALASLGKDHTVYRSFYLLERTYGRFSLFPYLEGITIDDLSPIIYSRNDLFGALMRDAYGNWIYDIPGGDKSQREMCLRLGINIIMYSLCGNYKQDQVHIPAILKRRKV